MTTTVSSTDVRAGELPEFPMARAAGCPFDPPPALRAMQQDGLPRKVRLWDGNTAWLVTRYADQRAVLADRRISSDNSLPGFPHENALTKAIAASLSFTRAETMKVTLDQDNCVASGQCVLTAPDVFDQRDEDGIAVLLEPEPPAERLADVHQAAAVCPALAITVAE